MTTEDFIRKFQKLVDEEDFELRAELEEEFLKKTAETLSSRDQESALEVAANFDRFKKKAAKQDQEFYYEFFDLLSRLIKRKYLDSDEDFAATDLGDF